MNSSLLERRAYLAKARSQGVSLPAAVTAVAKKFNTSPRNIYRDWETRSAWLESVLGIEDRQAVFLDMLSTHREVLELASLEFHRADNSSARLGALNLVRKANLDLLVFLSDLDLAKRVERLEEKQRQREAKQQEQEEAG